MIACPTPPSHHPHHHHDLHLSRHRRDASDSSSCYMMMDYDDDDCNVSTLSFGAPYSTPQQHQRFDGSSSRIGDSPPTPTPTHTSFTTNTTATNTTAAASLSTTSPTATPTTTNRRRSPSPGNVRVNVGGESFSFPQTAFQQQFAALPWKTDIDGVYHLSSVSPAVFEVLLDYTLFGTLPAYDTLCDEEFQEFETIALSLMGRRSSSPTSDTRSNGASSPLSSSSSDHPHHHDLIRLIEHFDRKDSYLNKELRRGRRGSSSPYGSSSNNNNNSSSRESNFFMLNAENASSNMSPNSVAATQCARFLGAICSVLPSRRPLAANTNSTSPDAAAAKRLKLTHGQWCSSSQNVS